MRKIWIIPLILVMSMLFVSPTTTSSQTFTPPKNVIVIIGDGMSWEQLRLGSLVEYGNDTGLFVQQSQFYMGNMTTHAFDENITDSAAAATAMSTGWKVENNRIALLSNGTSIQTILEYSQLLGKKTGIVTNSYFYHATPASYAAHEPSRNDHEDIIQDMLTSDTDLILGGGIHNPSVGSGSDFDNLVIENNYALIDDKTELLNIGTNKTLGAFGAGHMPYETDLDFENDIRLTEMVTAAFTNLENENGFFLMIEGARIDHAGHDRNITKQVLEVIEFDRMVKSVYDWVQTHPDTTVIITGDHETGGLIIDGWDFLDSNLPNDSMSLEERRQRRIERMDQLNATLPTSGHTSVNIPIMAFGSAIDDIFTEDEGHIYDNTDIYRLTRSALDGEKFTEVFNYIGIPYEPEEPEPTPTPTPPTPSSSDDDVTYGFGVMVFGILFISRFVTLRMREH